MGADRRICRGGRGAYTGRYFGERMNRIRRGGRGVDGEWGRVRRPGKRGNTLAGSGRGRRKRPLPASSQPPPLRGRSRFRSDMTKYLPVKALPLREKHCISANLWEREKIIEYRRTLHRRTLQSTERRGRWLNLLLCSIQRWRWRRRRWSERLA